MSEKIEYILSVTRKKDAESPSYVQKFSYTGEEGDTVATAIKAINDRADIKDIYGNAAEPVFWECGCLQKKCGACAMVVNGTPRLACSVILSEAAKEKGGIIEIGPLKKFPVIKDLAVDRSILFENLKTINAWLKKEAVLTDAKKDLAINSSECLQCGCCLEICPNFYAGGKFFGMAAVPVTTRILAETDLKDRKELSELYKKHEYGGCGKSLSCKTVCPKKIDTENLLVNANALAVWKRK